MLSYKNFLYILDMSYITYVISKYFLQVCSMCFHLFNGCLDFSRVNFFIFLKSSLLIFLYHVTLGSKFFSFLLFFIFPSLSLFLSVWSFFFCKCISNISSTICWKDKTDFFFNVSLIQELEIAVTHISGKYLDFKS